MTGKYSYGDAEGPLAGSCPVSEREESADSPAAGTHCPEVGTNSCPVTNVRRRKASGRCRIPQRLGVVLPYPFSFFLQERFRGVLTASEETDCELVLYCVRDADEYERCLDLIATEKKVDGLVVLSLLFPKTAVMRFLSLGVPVCLVNSETKGFCSVCTDIREIGRASALSLFEKGYRKPAFFGEPTSFSSMVPMEEDLYRGFKNSWADRGITLPNDFVWFGPYAPAEIERAVSRFISYGNLPDCIFIPCDCMALVMIRELEKNGLRVPEQIAVMGAGNNLISNCFSISSVDMRLVESGYLAVRAVLECMTHRRRPSCHFLSFEIIDRATVSQRG